MSTITIILEPNADGTLRLPIPSELGHGKIEVTATLKPADGVLPSPPRATAEMLRQREEALDKLRELGGLRDVIPDPVFPGPNDKDVSDGMPTPRRAREEAFLR